MSADNRGIHNANWNQYSLCIS